MAGTLFFCGAVKTAFEALAWGGALAWGTVGALRRPIGTAEALRTALLAADSIAWADASSGATAGKHFESVSSGSRL